MNFFLRNYDDCFNWYFGGWGLGVLILHVSSIFAKYIIITSRQRHCVFIISPYNNLPYLPKIITFESQILKIDKKLIFEVKKMSEN